jgi:hypothetical protein
MNWQPECIGRVILNMPTDRPRSWSNEFDMAEVTRVQQPMSLSQFWSRIEAIKDQYAAQTHTMVPTRLGYFEKTGPNAAFLIWYDNDASLWGPNLDRYLHLDDTHVYQLKTPTLPIRNAKPTPALFKPFIETYTPALSRIHPMREAEIPSQSGLCIDGAVVSGETGKNALAATSAEIFFGTRLGIGYRENQYNVERLSGFENLDLDQKQAAVGLTIPDAAEGFREFKVLRKNERLLAGLLGQEFITRTTLNSGHVYYRFHWGLKGGVENFNEPAIVVHLNTPKRLTDGKGKPYSSLPAEDELIRFWDSVLRTFKVRPNALPDGQTIRAVN